MYNQIYNTVEKITDGQKKKHFLMFTNDEKIYILSKLQIVKKYAILSYHLQQKNNGITIQDINKIFENNNYSIIEYNETTRNNITDNRVLIRSNDEVLTNFFDVKLNCNYDCYCNICFVISIKTAQIITAYFNKASDYHVTINFDRYENLQIIKNY